ncbi:hypothetical protein NIES2109_12300 [Nostoc sp. HK-01]|uniref:Uncharacterized protein n=2 Tax=Nostocales TaxID=1161 RepID=A0A1Z4GIU9_9CYAN|nr:hypothetical protein [Nostoc cycadae]BAY17441.1 hypothetical protein NIES21_32790 [Anabaenopsis circularis NIES-21]BBD58455.1 hypothetical protein NIES2109_12300 [Nostoc sp. HK-01]GBE90791.1 hypothetical protein NCWK1_0510 [Nostoc cycadae WK-1]
MLSKKLRVDSQQENFMAQRKRNSIALTKAERRIEGIQAINPELDFGNGCSIVTYNTKIYDVREKLAAYNQARIMVEKAQNALLESERGLNDFSEQMLVSVASRFGKDSYEYGMAGGTRKSNRKKPRSTIKQKIKPVA